jgi:hypothetical protein
MILPSNLQELLMRSEKSSGSLVKVDRLVVPFKKQRMVE